MVRVMGVRGSLLLLLVLLLEVLVSLEVRKRVMKVRGREERGLLRGRGRTGGRREEVGRSVEERVVSRGVGEEILR